MGYNWVKTGVNLYKYAVISTPEKKGGERREKKFKISCFFAKHSFHIFRFLDF